MLTLFAAPETVEAVAVVETSPLLPSADIISAARSPVAAEVLTRASELVATTSVDVPREMDMSSRIVPGAPLVRVALSSTISLEATEMVWMPVVCWNDDDEMGTVEACVFLLVNGAGGSL